jgi:aspartate racemase
MVSDNEKSGAEAAPAGHGEGPGAAPVWRHTIGIVGGLGPYAHLELERHLLAAAARRLGRPLRDQDYPAWVLSSIPATPDRTVALLGEGPSPLPWLVRSAKQLEGSPESPGAGFIVIACNTAHAWLEELRAQVEVPILDVVSETVREAGRRVGPGSRIGILATTGTLRAELYQRAAAKSGSPLKIVSLLDCSSDEESGEWLQEYLVMEPIYGPLRGGVRTGGGVKSGGCVGGEGAKALAEPLRRAVRLLGEAGANIVVTACTEVPVALGDLQVEGISLLDPMRVAADVSVAIALGERPLPDDS